MQVLIDGHSLTEKNKTGKHFYSLSLLNEVRSHKKSKGIYFHLLVNKRVKGLHKDIHQIITSKKSLAYYLQLRSLSKNYNYTLSPTSYIPSLFVKNGLISVIYDLAVFEKDKYKPNLKAKIIEKALLSKVIKNSTHILTISESVNQQIRKKFPHSQPITIPAFSKFTTQYSKSLTAQRGKYKNYFLLLQFPVNQQ